MEYRFNYSMHKSFLADKIVTYGCSGVKLADFPETVSKKHRDAIFRLLQHQNIESCNSSLHILHLECEDQLRDYEKCDFASTMRDLFRDVPNDREQLELSLNRMFPFEKPIEKNE